ncbi:hypothetical protein HDU96_008278 [Phlyctochytrium bullatum]|nr:hypothetical protein HDU96_008278 [Phlyctochytrium bullatum]
MLETFKNDVDGKALKNTWLINRRNWTSISHAEDSLQIVLRVENADRSKEPVPYAIMIPALN